jgi:CcmD family protein
MNQTPPNSATLDDPSARSTEFVPVQGGGETTSAAGLLITAYVVMWALLLGFVFLSWRRQGRVETRISELEKALSTSGSKDGARD